MGGDVAPRPGPVVVRHQARGPVQPCAWPRDQPAQAVEPAQLAGGDPDQGDEIVAGPEPVRIALAGADAAAPDRRPEGGVVDLDAGAQLAVDGPVAPVAAAPPAQA